MNLAKLKKQLQNIMSNIKNKSLVRLVFKCEVFQIFWGILVSLYH